ncbi:MAG: exodeoxyribonuclease VII large subunit [Candidatus Magasanikbacteria bacterium]|nr:exodeoxyribonuclease VII large subunit [Candidatus Magasanikbacteria bacterium]
MHQNEPYKISEFIEIINSTLGTLQVQIIGEVSEVKVPASGHVYFSLKDKDTGDVLPCIMWKGKYMYSGVDLEVGMEVQLKGAPSFSGRFSRMSFVADAMEVVGEGALKKAYEKLKKKLAEEGLFDLSRKRPLPLFPQKIGVITSVHGAVIHDFSNNLRRSGFKIKILDCRVEGPECGRALALSVRAMRDEDLDVLVLIRGGGSMQSLAGFDNEKLVREIAAFPVPVVTGIGHHQDVPLATLVADATESTPSLVAALLSKSWLEATYALEKDARRVVQALHMVLATYKDVKDIVKNSLAKIQVAITGLEHHIINNQNLIIKSFVSALSMVRARYIYTMPQEINQLYGTALKAASNKIANLVRLVEANNPERQLRLGYSLVFVKDRVVRSVKDVLPGEQLNIRVVDGEIESVIKNINKK